MVDTLTPAKRSWNMSKIRSRNTNPEIIVRRLLSELGCKYSTYSKTIPGTPDMVLSKGKTAIFVHGCFWHRHNACRKGHSTPTSNTIFWANKLGKNVQRQKDVQSSLRKSGWKVLGIWECQTRNKEKLTTMLRDKLKFKKAIHEKGVTHK